MSTTTLIPTFTFAAQEKEGSTQLDKHHIGSVALSNKEKRELVAETASINSATTTLVASDLPFTPAKSFHINSRGIPVLRLPFPPSELITTIHNLDGSVAYTSTRERRSSGNCVLSDAGGTDIIGTTYVFGPGKDPVLTRLDLGTSDLSANTIKTLSKWTTRTQTFLLPDGRTFTWSYKRAVGFGGEGKKGTALVLTMGEKRIAVLIRDGGTRTLGSSSSSAGNGGELVIGEEVGGNDYISEEVVVSSCLLMLKKEIDRRRMVQFIAISSAVSA
ncbi:hypothetical protein P280DRAFT_473949 [Massarina eburnea CBS 473.64]|uniref:Uncharacterized protein n=1 Tax=Massarina eburnea CBS 473.64 TaxID=1395130 RepID=A0A6A6RI67_9PLEO|nr:hypothetical protein P280DRAFT_473949 [Massarina eburnea CBS 473.64]